MNLLQDYRSIREQTNTLCIPLQNEDYLIQAMEDVSPTKWHLAHTTWFFETFILLPHYKQYSQFNPAFHHLFNSYYQSVGKPYPRAKRGLLSRPTVTEIYSYRKYVDVAMIEFLQELAVEKQKDIEKILRLGLQHEQQHQELLLMDIKYNFSINPAFPNYLSKKYPIKKNNITLTYTTVPGNVLKLGYSENEFCYDNELPEHEIILKSYTIANRLVTNAEYAEFIAAGGYESPEWWLADGWDCVCKNNWQAPLYWYADAKNWRIFSLNGLQDFNPDEPVAHVSYYEADAYARWRNCRLPLEAEWEYYARPHIHAIKTGNFLENLFFHPQAAKSKEFQLFGDLWEWTASAYMPYPGFKPLYGALGEYNGKFMSNQMVLRGGCCVTPRAHIRASYRNFYAPDKRWPFTGIRLAKDI